VVIRDGLKFAPRVGRALGRHNLEGREAIWVWRQCTSGLPQTRPAAATPPPSRPAPVTAGGHETSSVLRHRHSDRSSQKVCHVFQWPVGYSTRYFLSRQQWGISGISEEQGVVLIADALDLQLPLPHSGDWRSPRGMGLGDRPPNKSLQQGSSKGTRCQVTRTLLQLTGQGSLGRRKGPTLLGERRIW